MPTYEYKCETCEHLFEVFQSIKEDPLDSCPKCGNSIKRLIGGGMGIFFKGSGFYSTDNRSGSEAKEAKKEKTSEKAEVSSGDKKSTSDDTASKKPKESAKKPTSD